MDLRKKTVEALFEKTLQGVSKVVPSAVFPGQGNPGGQRQAAGHGGGDLGRRKGSDLVFRPSRICLAIPELGENISLPLKDF